MLEKERKEGEERIVLFSEALVMAGVTSNHVLTQAAEEALLRVARMCFPPDFSGEIGLIRGSIGKNLVFGLSEVGPLIPRYFGELKQEVDLSGLDRETRDIIDLVFTKGERGQDVDIIFGGDLGGAPFSITLDEFPGVRVEVKNGIVKLPSHVDTARRLEISLKGGGDSVLLDIGERRNTWVEDRRYGWGASLTDNLGVASLLVSVAKKEALVAYRERICRGDIIQEGWQENFIATLRELVAVALWDLGVDYGRFLAFDKRFDKRPEEIVIPPSRREEAFRYLVTLLIVAPAQTMFWFFHPRVELFKLFPLGKIKKEIISTLIKVKTGHKTKDLYFPFLPKEFIEEMREILGHFAVEILGNPREENLFAQAREIDRTYQEGLISERIGLNQTGLGELLRLLREKILGRRINLLGLLVPYEYPEEKNSYQFSLYSPVAQELLGSGAIRAIEGVIAGLDPKRCYHNFLITGLYPERMFLAEVYFEQGKPIVWICDQVPSSTVKRLNGEGKVVAI